MIKATIPTTIKSHSILLAGAWGSQSTGGGGERRRNIPGIFFTFTEFAGVFSPLATLFWIHNSHVTVLHLMSHLDSSVALHIRYLEPQENLCAQTRISQHCIIKQTISYCSVLKCFLRSKCHLTWLPPPNKYMQHMAQCSKVKNKQIVLSPDQAHSIIWLDPMIPIC